MIVYFFTRQSKKEGRLLYCRLTRDNRSCEFKLDYKFTQSNNKLGYYKEQVRDQLLELYNNQLLRKEACDPAHIKTLYLTRTRRYYLIKCYEDYLEKVIAPRVKTKDIGGATKEKFEVVLNHLKDFLDARNMQDIDLQLVDTAFIKEFDDYLRNFNGHNTAKKNLGRLRSVLTWVRDTKKYMSHNPFVTVKLTQKKVKTTYLTDTEILLLINKKFDIDRLSEVRDIFLFQCFTGLSYIDVKRIDKNWIENQVIRLERQKNDEPAIVYMFDMAMLIMDKYGKELPIVSNQKTNAYLKEIADLCRIRKRLTSHVARHTFATTVTLNNGISLEIVQTLLGHATIKQTEHYARLNSYRVLQECKQKEHMINQKYVKAAQMSIFNNQSKS